MLISLFLAFFKGYVDTFFFLGDHFDTYIKTTVYMNSTLTIWDFLIVAPQYKSLLHEETISAERLCLCAFNAPR
jgi:hypothetical protein